jgi:hypothetical protein
VSNVDGAASTQIRIIVQPDSNDVVPVRAQLLESPKQGRGFKRVVLMHVFGSDIGFYDEMGSVYVSDIVRRLE